MEYKKQKCYNDSFSTNSMYLDITDYILSQQLALGIFYQPIMSIFTLITLSIPFWSIYCITCAIISLLQAFSNDIHDTISSICNTMRTGIEGIYNPCALPIYDYIVQNYLSSYNDYFYYTNSLGMC